MMDNELKNEEAETPKLETQNQEFCSEQHIKDEAQNKPTEVNTVQKRNLKQMFNKNNELHTHKDSRQISKIEYCIMFLILVFAIAIFGFSVRNAMTKNTNDLLEQISAMKLQITKLDAEIIRLEDELAASDEKPINISISLDGKDYIYNPETDKWEDQGSSDDLPDDPNFDTRPFLGVAFNEGNDGTDNPIGLRIDYIYQCSPAEFAGIKSGDIIMSINGNKINTWNDLDETMSSFKANETIKIELATTSENGIEFKTVDAKLTYRGNFAFDDKIDAD